MTLVASGAEAISLNYLVNFTTSTENLVYGLFATNVTPAHTDTLGTYTAASGGGYSGSKTLTGASWTNSGSGPATAAYAQQTWAFTGALTTNSTIYGYYVWGSSTNTLYWAEAFTSFTPTNNGDNIKLTPQVTST